MTKLSKEEVIDRGFIELRNLIHDMKPNDRSEKDRLWAIAMTDLEKGQAFWHYKIVCYRGEDTE